MDKPHVAIFPLSVGMGHFLPLAEFAKRLCEFHGFSITLIISRWLWTSQQPPPATIGLFCSRHTHYRDSSHH
ncbi:hypothetical protein SUGI_1000540 [Cryptomeria japonica]|nr:hypothetical protein SUGI_1000540 [Cryptomeria japonica]